MVQVRDLVMRLRSAAGIVTILDGVSLVELTPLVLGRALETFPVPVRTLDALHHATMLFLRDRGRPVELASYDERLLSAGRALGLPLRAL